MRPLLPALLTVAVALLCAEPLPAQSGSRSTGSISGRGATSSGSATGRATGAVPGARSTPAGRAPATGTASGTIRHGGQLPTASGQMYGIRVRTGLPPVYVVPPGGYRDPRLYPGDPWGTYYSPRDPWASYYRPWPHAGYATGRASPRWHWQRYPQLGVYAGLGLPLVVFLPIATTHYYSSGFTTSAAAYGTHDAATYAPPAEPYRAPAPPVAPRPPVEECALVTVIQHGNHGYFKELRLPVMGALNADELQRVLEARVAEGPAFRVRDAAGEIFEVPAAAELRRVIVGACRQAS